MNEARPYASLSSGLLARKGSAKPAMRPQGYTGFDDLGWNDMGHNHPALAEDDLPDHVPSSIAALTPAPKLPRILPDEGIDEDESEGHEAESLNGSEAHPVAAQQQAIANSFDAVPEPEAPADPIRAGRRTIDAQVVPLPKRGKPLAPGRKAAFTLRLDAERHLRLRLACALTASSAQQFVTDALDELLASLPEVETLASRTPAKAGANGAKRR